MASLTEQIAALRPEQRARVDRLRIDGTGVVSVEWMGLTPVLDPDAMVDAPVEVAVSAWVKPDPARLQLDAGVDPAAELAELGDSGIVGELVVERLTKPDVVTWRAQAWTGAEGKALAVAETTAAMAQALAADADLRLARWRLRVAERAVQVSVRDALGSGSSAPMVGAALGVSRARVYQLRDGRR